MVDLLQHPRTTAGEHLTRALAQALRDVLPLARAQASLLDSEAANWAYIAARSRTDLDRAEAERTRNRADAAFRAVKAAEVLARTA